MREIKFRAWDKQENKWYTPTLRAWDGKLHDLFISFNGELTAHLIRENGREGFDHESLFPDRYILNQYTGLKDKNGKEIYEGDIINRSWSGHYKLGEDERGPIYKEIKKQELLIVEYKHDGFSLYPFQAEECQFEVIGNIYENKELMENCNE